VDAHWPGPAGAKGGDAMRDAGRADDDVAGPAFGRFLADPDQDAALQDDEALVVGVLMQLGPSPGRLCTRKDDTDDGPCLQPSNARERSLPGRFT